MKMKFYNFFFSVLFLFVWNVQAFSAEYFVSASAASSGDGSNWESAISGSDLQLAFSSGIFEKGDIIYLSGGTYSPGSSIDNFNITAGVTLIGGYDPASTGTTKTIPAYPSRTPTLFSGDLNANSVADDGDVQNILRIQSPDSVTIQGIQFSYAYYIGAEDLTAGAVFVKNSSVTFKSCIFDDSKSTYYGGAALTVWGSFIHALDCIFANNEALGRGGAIRSSDNKEDALDIKRATIVIERCLVAGNKNTSNTSSGKYGGGIQVTSGTLWVINSTITNNEAFSNGAGISAGDGYRIYVISSTLANNVCRRSGLAGDTNPYSYGASIRATDDARLNIANSIMVEKTDDGSKTNPTFFTESLDKNASELIVSGGYNITGTFYLPASWDDQMTAIWQTSDSPSNGTTINLYSTVFGTNELADNNGFSQTIAPTSTISGANITDLDVLVNTTWECPVKADLSVDQRGYPRVANTSIGAYDPNAVAAVNEVNNNVNALIRLGVNSYRIVSDVQSDVVVYDLTGLAIMNTNSNETIDLTPFSNGLYIIVSDGNSFKVVR